MTTSKEELREILGEEDWKYTDKPHRIKKLINEHTKQKVIEARINEALKEAEAAHIVAEDGGDTLMINYLRRRTQTLKEQLKDCEERRMKEL